MVLPAILSLSLMLPGMTAPGGGVPPFMPIAAPQEAAIPPWEAAPRDHDPTSPAWMTLHEDLVAGIRSAPPPDLLFIGDSITAQWQRQGLPVWQKAFAPRKAFGLGINGDTTQSVLWRLDHGEVDGIAPRVTVLLIGTNNIRHASARDVVRGIEAVAAAIRHKLPGTKLVVLGLFPRSLRADDSLRLKVNAVNTILARVDLGRQARYLDIGTSFLDRNGTLPKSIMADGLHPTERGYEVWAAALAPTLDSLLR
ncbi:MAG TPA: GDSL-type esterase/lipase family protein [Stellaceae bacterium]|nr:GDSL-type esterase/lipase family protein [Stellaceae bacterium]